MLDLNENWRLRDIDGDYQCDMRLPGDGVSALYEAGLIPDPYWGRNEYDVRWVSQRDWVLSRTLILDRTDLVLEAEGVDCVAEIRVNGTLIISAQNVHRTYSWPLDDVAKLGENEIEITFRSARNEGEARHKLLPFPVPWSTDNNPIPFGNALRKTQCDFGWDWNIALANFGVIGGIRLRPEAPNRVRTLHINQAHQPDGSVHLVVGIDVQLSSEADIKISFNDEVKTLRVGPGDDGKRVEHLFEVESPDLWWPAGQGDQPLYPLEVTLGDQVEKRMIGLRKVELVTEPDEVGASFKFRINGRDVFAKGANWIPADALPSRISPDKTHSLLQSAVDANMNMIRVWGGGRYESDSFYESCDALGLMVWQDFMFACSLYPSTPDFLSEVDAEVRENTQRLQHHACIMLWCGDNELVGALTWFKESQENRDRYLVSYDRLNRTIETALKETDPNAIWWPSSPSLGALDFGDGWHDAPSGDMHFWSVWHENREFEHYRDVKPRFCSEFGFQSYPSMNVIKQFAGPSDMNIASPVMESHQKNAGGNERIAATMFRYFRFPVDFESFVYLSQVQQGLAIKTAVDYWRSLKPHCMGTLIWQLNDTWPVCSWSSLDYGGGWKLLHHMARRFFAPVQVTAIPVGTKIELHGTNDTGAPVDIDVQTHAVDMAGTMRPLGSARARVGEVSQEIMMLDASDLGPQEVLLVEMSASDGSSSTDVFAGNPYKTYDLLAPNISADVQEVGANWQITLSAEALALFVALEADCAGRFDNNAFTVIPGHPQRILFTPERAGDVPNFTIRDLYSATYGAA